MANKQIKDFTDIGVPVDADELLINDTTGDITKKVTVANLQSLSRDTGSNVGTGGIGVYKTKTGTVFEFRNINSASSKISVANDTTYSEIDIDVVEANIVHQNISGAGSNTHTQIDDKLTIFNNNSQGWEDAELTLNNNSLSWNSTSTTLNNNSVGWANTESILNTNSQGWDNAESTLNTNSTGWNSIESTLNTNSESWVNAETTLGNNSSGWELTESTLNTNSGDWELTNTTLGNNSVGWESTENTVNNNSVSWANTDVVNTVSNNSGGWESTESTVTNNSQGWNNTESTLNTNSGTWEQTNTTLGNNSVGWENVESVVNTNSEGWEGTESTLSNNSVGWENTQTSVSNNSADWSLHNAVQLQSRTLASDNPTDGQAVVWNNTSSQWEPQTMSGIGEVNIGDNVGTGGVGLYKTKSGVTLQFKNINAGSNKISITNDTANDEVDVDVTEANIDHTAISNIGTNTHPQIDNNLTALQNNSIGWENTETILNNNSVGWEAAESTLSNNSTSWVNTETVLSNNSVGWESTESTLNTNSTSWVNVETVMSNNSTGWENTQTTLSNNSIGWENAESTLNTNSGGWVNATTVLSNNSTGWESTESTLSNNSTGWENTESVLNTNSAGWESAESTLNTNSGDWLKNIVEDTTPQLGGNLDLNQKSLILDPTPTSDHTYNGVILNASVGESVAIGDILYYKSDGKFYKADADNESTADTMIVMATASVASDAMGNMLVKGFIRDDTWNWSVADTLYISTTGGNPTNAAPSATGDIVRILGYAYSADIAWFNPDNTFVENS